MSCSTAAIATPLALSDTGWLAERVNSERRRRAAGAGAGAGAGADARAGCDDVGTGPAGWAEWPRPSLPAARAPALLLVGGWMSPTPGSEAGRLRLGAR